MPRLLAFGAQTAADLRRLEVARRVRSGARRSRHRDTGAANLRRRSAPRPGRNASSSGGLYGIGVSGVAMRQASSRSPSACSVTRASTSPAQPPVSGPSSTTTMPVRLRDRREHGRRCRAGAACAGRSPRPSMPVRGRARSAASRRRARPSSPMTIVTSRALARRPRASPSGRARRRPRPRARSSRLCSKKSTGLSSRIAALQQRPSRRPGSTGATILRPGHAHEPRRPASASGSRRSGRRRRRPSGSRAARCTCSLREEPVLRRLVDEAVHRERQEVAEHDLDHRAQARDRRRRRRRRPAPARRSACRRRARRRTSRRGPASSRRRRRRRRRPRRRGSRARRARAPRRARRGSRCGSRSSCHRHRLGGHRAAQRSLEQLAQAGQEARAVGAVDDAVVAGERRRSSGRGTRRRRRRPRRAHAGRRRRRGSPPAAG